MPKRVEQVSKQFPKALIVEAAWEVCNQVGGIYTVIRSKAPSMVDHAPGNYCLVGPYLNKNIQAELEPLDDAQDVFGWSVALSADGNTLAVAAPGEHAHRAPSAILAWFWHIPELCGLHGTTDPSVVSEWLVPKGSTVRNKPGTARDRE